MEQVMAKILIVEDEEPISNLIRMNLTKAGYQCKCAFDGKTAADMMAEGQFDLVLLDIMLPDMDGYELIEYIKQYDMPVIFVTAKTSVPDRVKGLKLGAEDYISGRSRDFSQVGVQAVDAYTVEYTLTEPTSYFMTMLGYGVFAPLCREYYQSQGGKFGESYNASAQD